MLTWHVARPQRALKMNSMLYLVYPDETCWLTCDASLLTQSANVALLYLICFGIHFYLLYVRGLDLQSDTYIDQ